MRTFYLLVPLLAFSPVSASANGNHFGWCNGVGNPHQAANCGGGGSPSSTQNPSNTPTANHQAGTGIGPGPGPGPTPGGTQAVVTVQPLPPTVVTGTSPVQNVTGQPGPTFTGTGLPPIVVTANPPKTFTGIGPVPQIQTLPTPSFTGTGRPPLTIQPLPPRTFTGLSPTPSIQTLPTPSSTRPGLPTITVVPNPPQTIVGYGPVPAAILVSPTAIPPFTGTAAVPQARPLAVPQREPQAVPQARPGATPVLVPRPRPQPGSIAVTTTGGGQITHAPTPRQAARGPEHVTPRTGRAIAHNPPRFSSRDGGRSWHCLASGHGKRRTIVDGEVAVTGALRHVGAVDVLGRDLPALHPEHTSCIISVRRRRGS